MKVLLLLTRRMDGPRSGRRVVLRTIHASLTAAGHEVARLCIDRTGTAEGEALPPPGLMRVAWNVLTRFVTGRRSLNECLYWSPTLAQRVADYAEEIGAELVVADMARTAQLAERCILPWIVDLDDLLSQRYQEMADDGTDAAMLLGYYAGQMPAWLRWPAGAIARLMLRREAKVLRGREVYYAKAADGVSLVAADEAQLLAERSGRDVQWMPMSVTAPDQPIDHAQVRPMSAVFMGGMDYQPNLEAVRWYASEVVPHLGRFGLDGLVLHVMGACPESVREELESSRIRFLGYVDDVMSEFRKHQVFVAPIVSGSGLKTKVLEAMAAGLPVVGTPAAFKGLGVAHDVHGYVASIPIEFAQTLRHVSKYPADAEKVGLAARALVRERFSPASLKDRWAKWVEAVMAKRA